MERVINSPQIPILLIGALWAFVVYFKRHLLAVAEFVDLMLIPTRTFSDQLFQAPVGRVPADHASEQLCAYDLEGLLAFFALVFFMVFPFQNLLIKLLLSYLILGG